MLIGITGTLGAGKGEKAWDAFARGCQFFLKRAHKKSDNLNSVCKTPAPQKIVCPHNQVLCS